MRGALEKREQRAKVDGRAMLLRARSIHSRDDWIEKNAKERRPSSRADKRTDHGNESDPGHKNPSALKALAPPCGPRQCDLRSDVAHAHAQSHLIKVIQALDAIDATLSTFTRTSARSLPTISPSTMLFCPSVTSLPRLTFNHAKVACLCAPRLLSLEWAHLPALPPARPLLPSTRSRFGLIALGSSLSRSRPRRLARGLAAAASLDDGEASGSSGDAACLGPRSDKTQHDGLAFQLIHNSLFSLIFPHNNRHRGLCLCRPRTVVQTRPIFFTTFASAWTP